MANKYQGKITHFELAPGENGNTMLNIWITIPKLNEDIELMDEGALSELEEKYPFIKAAPKYYATRLFGKTCLVERDGDGNFHYIAYLTVNTFASNAK